MQIKNVLDELSAVPAETFLDLAEMNGHKIGACNVSGVSPVWEMHPDTDELFYVLEGEFVMTLLMQDGPTEHVAPAGTVFVVPQGIWHKPAAPGGAKFLYLTPGESLHSDKDDPLSDLSHLPQG